MKKLGDVFYKHKVTTVLMILVLVLGISKLPWLFNYFTIKASSIPVISQVPLNETVKEIPIDGKKTLVGETQTKQLYINPSTLDISIVDKPTKKEWHSIYEESKSSDTEKSLVNISFLGKDSKIYEWNSYKYCITNQTYSVNQIENGVQIKLTLAESSSNRLEEYMPKKIAIERYEEVFLGKLDELVQAGQIEEKLANKYKSTLKIIYQKDTKNGCYYNKYLGNPPISAINLLIDLSKTVGYTTEMLIADSEAFGISVDIKPTPQFDIIVEAYLDEEDLVVRIPTYEMVQGNDFYDVQNIQVLPNFGAITSAEVEDGYILVPDGAGALFELNSYNGSYPEYSRSLYDNNYYKELYEMNQYPEDMMMPVFGMIYGKGDNATHGFMSIIETGAELASIQVKLATTTPEQGGTIYNKVFSTFDAMQYARLKIFGPYSDDETRYLKTTGPIDVDYTIRYKLFPTKVSYFDMAQTYQDYLVEKYQLTTTYDTEPKLFLDVIGAVTLEERLAGIPYESIVSLTTYQELKEILADLEDMNLVVNYSGVFNEGMNNQIMNGAVLTSQNGKEKDLQVVIDLVDASGNEMYLGTNLMKVYANGKGYAERTHAMIGYDGQPVTVYDYNLATGIFKQNSNSYQLVHPKYLTSVVDRFIAQSKTYPNIYIADMGNTYYANYKTSEIITPIQANQIVTDNLAKLAEEKTLVLNNPIIDQAIYGKYAMNISRESSHYGTMYMAIPFRQLVMNGLVGYTTLDINMSTQNQAYYLLQALELGSYPKFTVTSKGYDVLKNSAYTQYFATEYSNLKESIKAFYEVYQQEISEIQSTEIINHTMIDENVFKTEYASGVSVITNYNNYDVSTPQGTIKALGYIIIND